MKEKPPKKPAIKTAMRIPAELHADIKDAALRADHSMNDEIVIRLTAAGGGASLSTVLEQNRQLMAELKRTQEMIQSIAAAITPHR